MTTDKDKMITPRSGTASPANPAMQQTASAGIETSRPGANANRDRDGVADSVKSAAGSAAATVKKSLDDASDYATNTAAAVRDRLSDGYERTSDFVGDSYERSARYGRDVARRGRRGAVRAGEQTAEFFEEYPLMVGAVGFAAGLILGAALPRTRSEDKYLGRWRDELERESARIGRETVAQARRYATEAMSEARELAEREVRAAANASTGTADQFNGDKPRGGTDTARLS